MVAPKFSERTWLTDLAKTELEALIQKGITPTWEQVVMIQDLSKQVETPELSKVAATGMPVTINRRTFWPFTVQAAEWYSWASENLPEDYFAAALLYAHEHGRERGAFRELYDTEAACEKVDDYRMELPLTVAEVEFVIDQLDGNETPGDDARADLDELIASLVAHTGIEPDVWTSDVSLDYIGRQFEALNAKEGNSDHAKAKLVKATGDFYYAVMEVEHGARS